MKVLVLGGTGWVGHHIALAFERHGHEVTIASRGQKRDFVRNIPPHIQSLQVDKKDVRQMSELLKAPYEVIADSVPEQETIEILFKHAKHLGHYLHCSSCGGYAPLPYLPGDETCPYGDYRGGWKNKGVFDSLALSLFHENGFPATVIRPPNIMGPGKLPIDNLGGRHEDFIKDIWEEKPLPLPEDGKAILQPIHVRDLGESFALAVKHSQKSIGQVYNICLEKGVTLTRYLEILADALGKKLILEFDSIENLLNRFTDRIRSEVGIRYFAEHCLYDISKAKEQLDFKPQISTEGAIREIARWSAAYLGLSTQ